MTPVFSVATEAELPYVTDLQRKNKESLGFLPSMALSERVTAGRVFMGWLGGAPFGYLLFDYQTDAVNVLQACIQYDARRRVYGAQLYGWGLEQWDTSRVRLKCAADLESNLFWRSLGLVCVGVKDGGARRGRKINIWNHFLRPGVLLFSPEELATDPVFQRREDCRDIETGFLVSAPEGFIDRGSLGKLAWSNRKSKA
jgi:hypothetical protein